MGLRSLLILVLCSLLAGACGDDAVSDDADAMPSGHVGEPSGPTASGPNTGGPGGSATETNVAPIRDAGSEDARDACAADDCDAGS